ncbi:MAG: PPOX class F420-dependent oxidoreductase [Chloroflexota bacterium]
MNEQQAREFLTTHKQGIVATIQPDGRPQLSSVLVVRHDDALWVSIAETRVKYRNLERDPRASILILGDNFWEDLVVEGHATMTHQPVALPMLREYFETAQGKPHPDWEEYDEAMRTEKRVLLSISIDRMYPLTG